MTDRRDFFISFNGADLACAEVIDAALRMAGFTTYFHPRDLKVGGNIAIWMDDALMNSAQTLALYSPNYTADRAVYSKAERYATWWQDPGSDKRKLIPVMLAETQLSPLIAPIKYIDVKGKTAADAAAHVVAQLNAADEQEQRDIWRRSQPLPAIFHAAYRPNPNFTGRFEALESLHRTLRQGSNAAITAVAGMGGIGKTTLAAEYCHRFGGRYAGVWWIRAEQKSVMLSDLQALGLRLGVVSGENIEIDARATLYQLGSSIEPWLLVYDGAPNPDTIRSWLPLGAVRCVITSRFAEFGDIARVMRLDQWSTDITADYLLSRTGRTDGEAATALAESLGGLPLAAEQASAYLRTRKGVSFEDYGADISRLIKLKRATGAAGDYPDTVYAATVKSLQAVEELDLEETALDIIRISAFLSPDGVDLILLTTDWHEGILPKHFQASMKDKTVCENAISTLDTLSLVRRTDGPLGDVLIFHRLVLDVVRDWMGGAARDTWRRAATSIVNQLLEDDSGVCTAIAPLRWPLYSRLMPHVACLRRFTDDLSPDSLLPRILCQATAYLLTRGDNASALPLAEQALELVRQIHSEQSTLAICLDNLGGIYLNLGRLTEARNAHTEALAIWEGISKQDQRLAVTLQHLASLNATLKNFATAEGQYLRAAEIMRTCHGDNSVLYGRTLSNLGALYCHWNNEADEAAHLQQEEECKNRAHSIILAANGVRHPDSAGSYNNVAIMKFNRGQLREAMSSMARSVAIMLSLGMADHDFLNRRIGDLIHMWRTARRFDRAARLQNGDISDLMPLVERIEADHRVWVATDLENRHFGPPSPITGATV